MSMDNHMCIPGMLGNNVSLKFQHNSSIQKAKAVHHSWTFTRYYIVLQPTHAKLFSFTMLHTTITELQQTQTVKLSEHREQCLIKLPALRYNHIC